MATSDKQSDDQLLVRYLLGVLPESETERLDELSVEDQDFAWRLDSVENDLVDAYVRGELSGPDLEQFKSSYLSSPRRRHKVEFARGLLALEERAALTPAKAMRGESMTAAAKEETRRAWPRFMFGWGFAAAALAMLLVAAYLFDANMHLRKQMTETQAERAALNQRNRDLEEQLKQQKAASAATTTEPAQQSKSQPNLNRLETASLILPPPMRGATRLTTLSLPSRTDLVVLLLAIESDDFPAYRATLKDPASNRVLWRSSRLQAAALGDKKAVSISFPSSLLKQQNYLVELAGLPAGAPERIGEYPFRVVLK